MASISALYVSLQLQAESFNAGLKNAQREAKEFEKTIRPSMQAAKDMGLAMAAAGTAIVGGMLAASKAAIDYGDNLNDLRMKTGVSVENLAKLGFAAEQSGSSMDGMSTGLKFLAKNMEAAIAKGGDQRAAFNALGLTSKDLAAANGDVNKVFLTLADRFKGIEDPAEKAALAMRIYGKSGVELIPVMEGGSAAIIKMGNDAQAAGRVISQDFATACDKLNDTLTAVSGAAMGVSVSIATALMPSLQNAATLVAEGGAAVARFTKEHEWLTQAVFGLGAVLAVGGTLLLGITAFGAIIGPLTVGLGALGITLTAATAAAGAMAIGVAALGAVVGVAAGSFVNWMIEGTRVEKWIDSFTTQAVKSLVGGWGSTSEAAKDAAFTAKASAKALEGVTIITKATTAAIPPHTDALKKHIVTEDEAAASLKKHTEEMKKHKEEAAEIIIKLNEWKLAQMNLNAVQTTFILNNATAATSVNVLRSSLLAAQDGTAVLDGMLLAAGRTSTSIAGLAVNVDVLKAKMPEMGKTTKEVIDEAQKRWDTYEKAVAANASKVAAAWSTAMGNITSGIAKGLSDAILHGESFKTSMIDLFKKTADGMLQSFLAGLISPLTSKIGELGSKLSGLIFGGGSSSGGLGALLGIGGSSGGGLGGLLGLGGGAGGGLAGLLGIGGAAAPVMTGSTVGGVSAGLGGGTQGGLLGMSGATLGITAAIAGGIAITTAWLKSQAHHEANTFVKSFQDPFGKAIGDISNAFAAAEAAGQLTEEQALEAKRQVEVLWGTFTDQAKAFARKGKDEAQVVTNAFNTLDPLMAQIFSDMNKSAAALKTSVAPITTATTTLDTVSRAAAFGVDGLRANLAKFTTIIADLDTGFQAVTQTVVNLTAGISGQPPSGQIDTTTNGIRTIENLWGLKRVEAPYAGPFTGPTRFEPRTGPNDGVRVETPSAFRSDGTTGTMPTLRRSGTQPQVFRSGLSSDQGGVINIYVNVEGSVTSESNLQRNLAIALPKAIRDNGLGGNWQPGSLMR